MRKIFFSLCAFVIMGGLASSLPHFLGGKLAGPGSGVADAAKLLAARYDEPELANAGGIAELRSKLAGQYDTFSDEEKAFFDNACPQMKIVKSPIAEQLLAMGTDGGGKGSGSAKAGGFTPLHDEHGAPAQALGAGEWQRRMTALLLMARTNYSGAIQAASKYLWGLTGAFVAAGLIALLFECYGCARFAGSALYKLSGWYLITLSLLCAGFQVIAQANIMGEIPAQFWSAPVCALLGSAATLHLVDMNFPFWNRTMRVLSVPILSAAVAYGWGSLVQTAGHVI
ncbi:MAG: hypothetical protein PHW69_09025 [Elusimicrobiaceae bacterium]|nr:hypothetical protein [Elusimicrobiaceae bacterium]